MKAKEYLMQIRKTDNLIQNKKEELQSLITLATSVTAYSDDVKIQSSGSNDKMADIVCKIVDLINEINFEIGKLIDLKIEVMRKIDTLDAKSVDILYQRYFQYRTWQEIADSMGVTYQWVCELHGKILQKIEKILNT